MPAHGSLNNFDLLFLKTCKRESLVPTFTRIKIPVTHQHHKRAIKLCYREILINEIKIKKRLLTQNYKVYNNLKSHIEVDLDKDTRDLIFAIINEIDNEKMMLQTEQHLKKLNKLRRSNHHSCKPRLTNTPISSIKNLSKIVHFQFKSINLISISFTYVVQDKVYLCRYGMLS